MSEPLNRAHDRKQFSSGRPELDRYLREQAGQDQRRNAARTYVWSRDSIRILGYYTLAATSVKLADVPEEQARKLAKYPQAAAILIGRLAIDESRQGQGAGAALLMDALARCLEFSAVLGASMVVVDAIDETAASFYERFGFVKLKDDPDRLAILMVVVEDMFPQSGPR